jgi:aspartyl-tRNA(Asn)/glutamyl-tRNA(Gln) amidotransferase subunit B
MSIDSFPISSGTLCTSISLMESGVIPSARFSEFYDNLLVSDSKDPQVIINKLGFAKVDDSQLESLCKQLLAANPKIVADIQRGNDKAVGALIGQAKKKNPNVDPGRVREICLRLVRSST